jgi:hypothetical protein
MGFTNVGERGVGSRCKHLALEAVGATSTADRGHYGRRCSPAHV